MPIFISETPITRITVPVTTGGKNRASRPTKEASTRPNSPAEITEP